MTTSVLATEGGQRAWTVSDSVERRFIQTNLLHPYNHYPFPDGVAHFSPDGEHFFVITFRGDLATDENVFDLLVYASSGVAKGGEVEPVRTVQMRSGGRFLHDFAAIYLPQWHGDDAITFVGTRGQARSIFRYDIRTAELRQLSESRHRIAESGGGEYAVRGSTTLFKTHEVRNVPLADYPFQVLNPEFLHHAGGRHARTALDATHWKFHASYKGGPSKPVASGAIGYSWGSYIGGPWISPDERWAVMLYQPEGWKQPAEWSSYSFRVRPYWYMLIDLQSGVSRPLASRPTGPGHISSGGSYELGTVFWSADSRHVLVANVAHPLAVTEQNPERARTSFFVDFEIGTGRAVVVGRFTDDDKLLAKAHWVEEGKSLFVTSALGEKKSTRSYRYDGRGWKAGPAGAEPPASKTPFEVNIEESATEAPSLVASHEGKRVVLLPAETFPGIRRVPIEPVEWTDSRGKRAKGTLLLPDGFKKGSRVPVLIQFMNTLASTFAPDGLPGSCDVAQSLTAHGFVVLQMVAAGGYGSGERDEPLVQTTAELAAQVARVDSAMDMLAERGVPRDVPVGLTGFSRTGMYVYYVTTHPSRTRIGAGVVCDSITNSFGEYINLAGTHGAGETQHFGQQFGNGKSFWQNKQGWLDAPEFNLDRLRSALLFHTHGNPVASATETVGAFLLARRPFEFHYYPDGGHALTSPRQQAAAMQSTIDWMRFWLQGIEREAPEDPERCTRWRKIKADWEAVSKEDFTLP